MICEDQIYLSLSKARRHEGTKSHTYRIRTLDNAHLVPPDLLDDEPPGPPTQSSVDTPQYPSQETKPVMSPQSVYPRYSVHGPALQEDTSDTLYDDFSGALSLNRQNTRINPAEDTEAIDKGVEELRVEPDLLYHERTPGELEGEQVMIVEVNFCTYLVFKLRRAWTGQAMESGGHGPIRKKRCLISWRRFHVQSSQSRRWTVLVGWLKSLVLKICQHLNKSNTAVKRFRSLLDSLTPFKKVPWVICMLSLTCVQ